VHVARAAVALQRGGEQLVDLLRAVALDQREQQVVERSSSAAATLPWPPSEGDLVLDRRGEQAQRAHALGEALLQHQHPAHVGVLDDAHARRGLVVGAQQVGPLDADLGELERVQVRGRERRHRLAADGHARVLDDVEHLADAVVDLADQQAARGGASRRRSARRSPSP
jgi:hypothetical protein